MATYIALLRKEAKSDFGVEFPDFPGCVTAGRTLEEAQALAPEALALHVDGMTEDGDEIPAPSSTDRIMTDPANRTAVVFLVEVALARCAALKAAEHSASSRPLGKGRAARPGIGGKSIHRSTLGTRNQKPAKGSSRTGSVKKSRSRRPA